MLILKVFFDFTLDIIHKGGSLSKIFSQKHFKFISGWRYGTVTLGLGFMLLIAKKKQQIIYVLSP